MLRRILFSGLLVALTLLPIFAALAARTDP